VHLNGNNEPWWQQNKYIKVVVSIVEPKQPGVAEDVRIMKK
jgi:hypothetical protein